MSYNINELEAELKSLDSIGGLEIKLFPTEPLWIETFRRMDGLYRELCIARLNLLQAAKETYPGMVKPDNDGHGDRMMQYVYAGNAILWYNNCFDLLLQVVWVYYTMWVKNPKSKVKVSPSDWTLEQIDKMKTECKYDKVDAWNKNNDKGVNAIVDLHNTQSCKNVRSWANEIKHRAPLFVKGVSTKPVIRFEQFTNIEKTKLEDGKVSLKIHLAQDKYDSGNSVHEYEIDDILSTLVSYHKEICECIEVTTSKIIEQYK